MSFNYEVRPVTVAAGANDQELLLAGKACVFTVIGAPDDSTVTVKINSPRNPGIPIAGNGRIKLLVRDQINSLYFSNAGDSEASFRVYASPHADFDFFSGQVTVSTVDPILRAGRRFQSWAQGVTVLPLLTTNDLEARAVAGQGGTITLARLNDGDAFGFLGDTTHHHARTQAPAGAGTQKGHTVVNSHDFSLQNAHPAYFGWYYAAAVHLHDGAVSDPASLTGLLAGYAFDISATPPPGPPSKSGIVAWVLDPTTLTWHSRVAYNSGAGAVDVQFDSEIDGVNEHHNLEIICLPGAGDKLNPEPIRFYIDGNLIRSEPVLFPPDDTGFANDDLPMRPGIAIWGDGANQVQARWTGWGAGAFPLEY